ELKALDNEYQDVYVIGVEKPIKTFRGKVIGIINRINDIEDKLVVCDKNKSFTLEQIKGMVNYQEKFFNGKIILNA
ncbi:MAG: inorganic pyrophosphatase, partial [Bacilli bacterium]|nr:inorganic pyrophosphatase [Bacilli bacterium]